MSNDLDRLVDQIASRVQERLGVSQTAQHNCEGNCVGSCSGCGHCVTENAQQVSALAARGATRVTSAVGLKGRPSAELAAMIDHTLLKPEATQEQLAQVCDEARKYHFATVCVNSVNIPYVARQLSGSGVKPIAVVGFPLGAATSSSKAFEARESVRAGAREIDMVINIGALKNTDHRTVIEDIAAVVEASKPYPVKVILETSALNDEEKIAACALSKAAGAAFVKTSTGFGKGGATANDIALMRRIVGPELGVKASGGIHSGNDATTMIQAGANRIGASASVAIVTGKKSTSSY